MKRTNSIKRFLIQNRRLLLFLLLPLCGCIGGLFLYTPIKTFSADWLSLLTFEVLEPTVGSAFSAWLSACFPSFCLLSLLFISGLSVCGAPCALLLPTLWGVGVGLYQAHYAQSGANGWLLLLAVILPVAAIEMVVILMASSESLHMSALLAAQLLPHSSRCGGLWQVFKLYCVRFLVFLLPIGIAGIWEVVLRLILGG